MPMTSTPVSFRSGRHRLPHPCRRCIAQAPGSILAMSSAGSPAPSAAGRAQPAEHRNLVIDLMRHRHQRYLRNPVAIGLRQQIVGARQDIGPEGIADQQDVPDVPALAIERDDAVQVVGGFLRLRVRTRSNAANRCRPPACPAAAEHRRPACRYRASRRRRNRRSPSCRASAWHRARSAASRADCRRPAMRRSSAESASGRGLPVSSSVSVISDVAVFGRSRSATCARPSAGAAS